MRTILAIVGAVVLFVIMMVVIIALWATRPSGVVTTQLSTATAQPTTSTPVPVAPSAPAQSASQPATSQSQLGCAGKDVGAVQAAIGLSVVCLGTEYDAYTWRSVPIKVNATVADGWIATLHLSGDKIVVTEKSGTYEIVAGTFRRKAGYPASDAVHNTCSLLLKEQAFGASQTPSFPVEALGFSCDGKVSVQNQPAQPAPAAAQQAPAQPTLTVSDVASWCTNCSSRLIQLIESNGKPNPAGVKLTAGQQCFAVSIPAGILWESWDGQQARSGQEAIPLPKVCEASFRKAS